MTLRSTTLSEFPEFFSLTPHQYELLKQELTSLRKRRGYDHWFEVFEKRLATEVARLDRRIAEFDEQVAELTRDPWSALRLAYRRRMATYSDFTPRFRGAVRQAYRRGHQWDIDPATYEALVAQPCVTCGGPTGNGVGLDRLNCRGGYTPDNVRPMCGPCNIARGRSASP